MIGWQTCYNNDFSLQTRTVGIGGNLLEDGDVFELALVRNWSYKLLTDCCQPPLRDGSHCTWFVDLTERKEVLDSKEKEDILSVQGKKLSDSSCLYLYVLRGGRISIPEDLGLKVQAAAHLTANSIPGSLDPWGVPP